MIGARALHAEYGCLSVMASSFAHLIAHAGGCMPPCAPTYYPSFFFFFFFLPIPAHRYYPAGLAPSSRAHLLLSVALRSRFPSCQMVSSVLIEAAVPGLIAQSSGTVGPSVQTFLHESAVGFLLIVQSASTCPWRSFSTLQMKVG